MIVADKNAPPAGGDILVDGGGNKATSAAVNAVSSHIMWGTAAVAS